jgi:Tol biopolymer transport system component
MRRSRTTCVAAQRIGRARAALAAGLLLGSAACADLLVTPGGPADPDELLFMSGRNAPQGMLDIFRMRADGTEAVNLTNHPTRVYRGITFSPDGRRILFNSDRGPCYEIWVMDIDGSDARRLTSLEGRYDRCNYYPRYSPDGSLIAFTSSRGGSWSTWVMNPDGSDPREVTAALQQASPGRTLSDGWTPDGRVVFWHEPRDSPSPVSAGTYTVLPDGSDLRRLLRLARDWQPLWSPDGSTIAFTRYEDDLSVLYVMAPDGTGERKLAHLPGSSDFAGEWVWDNDHDPWSPDGSRLVFRNVQPGAVALYVVGADGTGLRRLTEPDLAARFNGWSPDGRRIAFTGTTTGVADVYVMNVDGTGLTNLTRATGRGSAAIWIPR